MNDVTDKIIGWSMALILVCMVPLMLAVSFLVWAKASEKYYGVNTKTCYVLSWQDKVENGTTYKAPKKTVCVKGEQDATD